MSFINSYEGSEGLHILHTFARLANGTEVVCYLCESKFHVHSIVLLSSNKQLGYDWKRFYVSELQRWGTGSSPSQCHQCHGLAGSVSHRPPRDRAFLLVCRASTEQLETRTRIFIVWF